MLSAATSCARAAISGVENVPSQMRDFLRGSRISDTHLPQLRIRTPRYTGCLLHSLGLLPDLRSGDLEAELNEKSEDVDSELFASAINVAAEEKEGDERGFCREGQGRTTMDSADAPIERPSTNLTIDNRLFGGIFFSISIHTHCGKEKRWKLEAVCGVHGRRVQSGSDPLLSVVPATFNKIVSLSKLVTPRFSSFVR